MQPISSAARSDEVPSAFYFWVRAFTEDAKQYRAGAARVVQRVDSKCDVTGFISKADILASRTRLADFFPADLIPKILGFAKTPKKVTNMRWQPSCHEELRAAIAAGRMVAGSNRVGIFSLY
jgi:hypothetical protein